MISSVPAFSFTFCSKSFFYFSILYILSSNSSIPLFNPFIISSFSATFFQFSFSSLFSLLYYLSLFYFYMNKFIFSLYDAVKCSFNFEIYYSFYTALFLNCYRSSHTFTCYLSLSLSCSFYRSFSWI